MEIKSKSSLLRSTCLIGLVVLSTVQATLAIRIPKSCLDLVQDKTPLDGFYRISDDNANTFTVYCDFSSESGFAWTLVISWALKFHSLPAFQRTPLLSNAPVNEYSPNWLAYRLSHNRMHAMKVHSTHWRLTCSFSIYKVDYRDYLRGNFNDFDIMTFTGSGTCKKVEFINIRGHSGAHVQARFWQGAGGIEPFHIDSASTGCSFDASHGSVASEDNFGAYGYQNKNFRCTANPSATTQFWFGGYY